MRGRPGTPLPRLPNPQSPGRKVLQGVWRNARFGRVVLNSNGYARSMSVARFKQRMAEQKSKAASRKVEK